jgi:NhaP-type Na+/H+ or K+/H+ antiporter
LIRSCIAAYIPPADAVFSTIAGILFGPLCANLINPYEWFNHDTHTLLNFTLHLSRIIIGIQVFFNGANLPKKYIKTEWLSLVMVLFPIMTFGWLLIGLLIWGIIPDLSYLEALVIAACIVPTDPVLANSICKGEQSVAGNTLNADEQVALPRPMYRLESEHC